MKNLKSINSLVEYIKKNIKLLKVFYDYNDIKKSL